MYLYKGFDPENDIKEELEFDDEYEAIDYARNNCSSYREYEVIDLEENEVVDSHVMAQDEEDASFDMMFPDGEDD